MIIAFLPSAFRARKICQIKSFDKCIKVLHIMDAARRNRAVSIARHLLHGAQCAPCACLPPIAN
jgi:hypothetical protein